MAVLPAAGTACKILEHLPDTRNSLANSNQQQEHLTILIEGHRAHLTLNRYILQHAKITVPPATVHADLTDDSIIPIGRNVRYSRYSSFAGMKTGLPTNGTVPPAAEPASLAPGAAPSATGKTVPATKREFSFGTYSYRDSYQLKGWSSSYPISGSQLGTCTEASKEDQLQKQPNDEFESFTGSSSNF